MESISIDMVYDAASQLIENKIKQHKVFSRPQFIEPSESFLIDGDYVTALNNVGINSIESIFAFEAAKNLTKKNLAVFRSRLQFEVDLPNASSPNTLFLKRYDNPPVVLQLKNWLLAHKRVSCGMLESETTQLLSEYGINTPRIIAYGEQFGILFEKRSFFITEKIPNAEALERKLPDYFHDGSNTKNLKLQRDFINHLARFIKKFHSTGYRHRDLYFSHIFLDDKERFFLIDLARAFRPILQAGRFRIKDIAQLYYSAPRKYFSTTDRLRFYISYIGRKKLNGTDKTFIKKVLKKVQQMVKHDKKHGKEAPFES